MQAAIRLSENLDAPSILETHRALMQASEPGIAGTWRTEQVWIGGGGYSPHLAAFIPPHASRVPATIEDLVGFCAGLLVDARAGRRRPTPPRPVSHSRACRRDRTRTTGRSGRCLSTSSIWSAFWLRVFRAHRTMWSGSVWMVRSGGSGFPFHRTCLRIRRVMVRATT
jgi:hypothetical protein